MKCCFHMQSRFCTHMQSRFCTYMYLLLNSVWYLYNTYFMQMSAPASLWLMSVVCFVLSQSRSTCPENQVLHSNGRCCQYVRCHPRKYITLLLSAFIMIINRLIDWLGSLIKIIFLIVMNCIVATIEKRGADRGSDFFTVYFLHWSCSFFRALCENL